VKKYVEVCTKEMPLITDGGGRKRTGVAEEEKVHSMPHESHQQTSFLTTARRGKEYQWEEKGKIRRKKPWGRGVFMVSNLIVLKETATPACYRASSRKADSGERESREVDLIDGRG